MAAAEIRSGGDQKKLFWAIGLGVVAIIAMWWTFFGFGGSSKPQRAVGPTASPTPAQRQPTQRTNTAAVDPRDMTVVDSSIRLPAVPEPRRNIFAYYEPPPTPAPQLPTPSPSPPPPILLASISPANVYAKTEDFLLEVRGDKFSPATQITIDGRPVTTNYIGPQQLSTTVPAAVIANPGQRTILVKSSDGQLFSNPAVLTVNAPPTPNYNYIGLIGKRVNIGDTAYLQDKSSKEIISVQRGDPLSGRFKVISISDHEVVVVDTNLKIKHKLQLTNEGDKGPYPQGRPTPRVQSEDDEP